MVNRGIAFGWWQGIWSVVPLIVWLIVMFFALKTRELWERVGLLMIGVGGAGNLYLRLTRGVVVDNLNFFNLFYNNVWDYLIAGGIAIYAYRSFVRGRSNRRN